MRSGLRMRLWNRTAAGQSTWTFRHLRCPRLKGAADPSAHLAAAGFRCRWMAHRKRWPSEIAFPLFDLHRPFLVVVDYAVLALGAPHQHHLFDDFRNRVRF